jgi:hypothetical protein
MTAQSIVCRSCSTAVPYGRLSCPNCGELLASVAGARRAPAQMSASTAVAEPPDVLRDIAAEPSMEVNEPADVVGDLDDRPLALSGNRNGVDDDDLGGLLRDDDDGIGIESTTTAAHAWAVAGASLTGPATPSYMPRPRYGRGQAGGAEAAHTAPDAYGADAAATGAFAPAPAPPDPMPAVAPAGAYVPPLPVSALPAGPAVPARAWAGQANGTHPADDPPAEGSPKTNRPMDATRVAEFIGSVFVAGAALAAVGFLLPWASVVIGSSGTSYFDRWGLAGPAHILVVAALLAILALAIVRNPIPPWIRTGLAGLGVGALLLGLTWPYLLGPLDAAPGVLIDAIGAIALIGSGLLALVTDRRAMPGGDHGTGRHAETDQPV